MKARVTFITDLALFLMTCAFPIGTLIDINFPLL